MNRRYYNAVLVSEAKKRALFRHHVKSIVQGNFGLDRPKLGIKRNKVYDLVSRALVVPNSARFKRMVREILRDLGIRAVCVHKTYLFRGIYDQPALEAWEAHQREKAARKAARLAALKAAGNQPD